MRNASLLADQTGGGVMLLNLGCDVTWEAVLVPGVQMV